MYADGVPQTTLSPTSRTTPTSPPWPIALRPEFITPSETTITIRNTAEPWHPLDYTITTDNNKRATLFTVHGHPFSLGHRRTFRDASGLPLFELQSRWYDSSTLELKLPGAGSTPHSDVLLSAKCRVAIQAPRAVLRFRNAYLDASAKKHQHQHPQLQLHSADDDTVMEIRALDLDNHIQVVVAYGRRVAVIERIVDPVVLLQGQKPPFRFRPVWSVRVASGVDLALIAVAVVIVGQVAGVGVASP